MAIINPTPRPATDLSANENSAPGYAGYVQNHGVNSLNDNGQRSQTYFGGYGDALDPNGNPINGTSAADQDVERYRKMGAAAQPAAQLDQTQANESRGLQMGALGLLRQQSDGSAPSSAAILSQRANQNAIAQAGQIVAGAKSAGGGIAALRGAGNAAGNSMLAGNAANADARAGEISRGQSAYASSAGALNAGDIGAATTDAQLEAQQHALDQQRRQGFERMAWNTRNAQLLGQEQGHRQFIDQGAANEAASAAEKNGLWNKGKDLFSGATSILSDERTKTHIGSLSSLMRGRR